MATSSVSNQNTIQQIIDKTAAASGNRKTGEMGKDEFLNLLVTQLKYQDPLNPVDDKEFIGQMAQFSSLEQMQNLNTSMTQSQAYSLIGKSVSANYVDEQTMKAVSVAGEVTGVKVSGGKTYVIVNGKEVPVEKISQVADGAATRYGNVSQYTNLIGMTAKGFVYDYSTGELVTVDGVVKSIQMGSGENYAVMDGVKAAVATVVDSNSTDPDYVKNYLKDNKGKEISVIIKDPSTGQKVAVKAVLKSYATNEDGSVKVNSDGTIDVVLDGLEVPVDSIHNVKPTETQTSREEELLQKILDKLNGTSDPEPEDDGDGSTPDETGTGE